MKASALLDAAQPVRERVEGHLRPAADWFHENEGELFPRAAAADALADNLGISDDLALDVIRSLVEDAVDPVTQVPHQGEKYVGVVEYNVYEGAYGYVDYDDVYGQRKRVVCARCVQQEDHSSHVSHATEGQGTSPIGSTYSELVQKVHLHYHMSHSLYPSDVETGASLVSGSTIAGNTAWHAGNDGGSSGLDADTVDGQHASDLGGEKYDHLDFHSVGGGDSSTHTFTPDSGVWTLIYIAGDDGGNTSNSKTLFEWYYEGGGSDSWNHDDNGGGRDVNRWPRPQTDRVVQVDITTDTFDDGGDFKALNFT